MRRLVAIAFAGALTLGAVGQARAEAEQPLAACAPPLNTVNLILQATETGMDRLYPDGRSAFTYPAVERVDGDWALVSIASRVVAEQSYVLVAERQPNGWRVVWGPDYSLAGAQAALHLPETLAQPCPGVF